MAHAGLQAHRLRVEAQEACTGVHPGVEQARLHLDDRHGGDGVHEPQGVPLDLCSAALKHHSEDAALVVSES